MSKPKASYIGDAALKQLLARYRCPTPFHVVRMRFWGAIVSPALEVSPVKTIAGLWPGGLPTFAAADEANAFFQAFMGLWNNLARFQNPSLPLRLQKVGKVATREALHAAAKLRVEELYDGFMLGFTGGNRQLDVPLGVGDLLARVEKGIELLATTRNTFAKPPGPEDGPILAELGALFPESDRAVQADIKAIAAVVKEWREDQHDKHNPTAGGGIMN
jgi:hypothetical protein